MDKQKRARASAKTQLAKIGNFVNTEAATSSATKLSVKLEILEKWYANFHKVQDEIESLTTNDDDLAKETEEVDSFDEQYCELKAELLDLIKKLTPSVADVSHTNNHACHRNHAPERFFRLPEIKLKPFKGNYLEYTSFKDMFNSMIISSQPMDDVNKLFLLKSSLEDEPFNLIKQLELVRENYSEAWRQLDLRYANKSLLIKAHLAEIFSIEKCNGNVNSLKTVLDTMTTNVFALTNLDLESSSLSDAILYHIISSKLDTRTKDLFNELPKTDTSKSEYQRLIEFLSSRVNILADLPSGKDLVTQPSKPKRTAAPEVKAHQLTTPSPTPSTSAASTTTTGSSFTKFKPCIECSSTHPLFQCPQFIRKTPAERFETVKNAKEQICFNCFRSKHVATNCTDKHSCKECGQKHHTMIHFSKESKGSSKPPESENSTKDETPKVLTVTQLATNQVLLATVSLYVRDAYGQKQKVRAFLDPGAQANLITNRLVDRLQLPTESIELTLAAVTNLQRKSNKLVNCEISSRVSEFKASIHAVVVPEICSKLPSQLVSTTNMPLHDKLLADPEFHKPNHIDLLLSGEHYLDLFVDGHIPETPHTPSMRNTVFGWIVAGKSTIAKSKDDIHDALTNYCSIVESPLVSHCAISSALEKFWSVEDIDLASDPFTMEEKACEKHFLENVERKPDGRFEVAIPFKADPSVLGQSRDIAVRVLNYTQRRLNADQRAEYKKFMDEYLKLGHMVKIENPDFSKPHAYLPHHPVIKETSKTTKLRAVFNATKPTTSGVSVNDIQMKGPTIQRKIFSILIRLRFYKVVICCDVEKLYRQVWVRRKDCEFQRIVWYDCDGSIVDFLLLTITYGMTSSPFLAIRCLVYLAEIEGHNFPLAAQALREDFFFDDGITGASSIAEARELVRQLNALAAKGKFTLRKWASNHPDILEGLDSHESNIDFLVNSDEKIGTLGMSWVPTKDDFSLTVHLDKTPNHNKRNILSEISKIFDPLGLATPVVITFKLFLRKLWKQGCNWDEPLSPELRDQWHQYRKSILSLQLERPRLVVPGETQEYEIHGFCDASEEAYCACLFIRSKNDDQYNIELLCSKSRVAPLQEQHIHRLELMGAALLSTLVSNIIDNQVSPPSAVYLWCDSQVALAWIKKDPANLKTFVGNRVQHIQSHTSIQSWHYVNTHQNPADIGSRGVSGEILPTLSLWWNGPTFLQSESLPVNENVQPEPPEAARELKKPKLIVTHVNIAEEFSIFKRFESATKLIRSIAWWLRYRGNLLIKTDANRVRTPLRANEVATAKTILIRLAQREDFDVDKLQRKGVASKKSKLRPLAPFLDENGVIRVGGRLQNANLTRNQRHPIVLSGTHPFAIAIVRDQHRSWSHPPHNLAMAALRQEFWVIGAKRLIKKITTDCITCKKARATFLTQQMGQLPPDRVNPSFPFQNVGLDYGGPIEIAVNGTRRRTTQKAYICLFVCLATKAVHIEGVTALSSNAFLDALSRFVARRGKPSLIRSDNGTNFRGAYNDLIRIVRSDDVQNHSANEGIMWEWEFIPPSTPHCGGIWEAGIKSVKTFLKKFDANKFDYEEFSTILTKIEGFLNSRPLSPLSDDPNDLEALTPGHFLVGRPLQSIPERDQTQSVNNRDRFIMRQKLVQQFWREWQADYLNRLQHRPKWMVRQPNITEGQLVLLREISTPQNWILGRVVKIHPGRDNLVRFADIRTAKGIVKRHVNHLIAL